MKIVGISPTHDSGVCLIENGKISKFFKEERLTRRKRDSNPLQSLKHVLNDIEEIDIFAYAPPMEIEGNNTLSQWEDIASNYSKINRSINLSNDHHKTHAALAFYNSGFDEAVVIVADAQGSELNGMLELESIFYASYPDNFIPIYKNLLTKYGFGPRVRSKEFENCEIVSKSHIGVVCMYCTATVLIGEHPLENGKTMGLSGYGDDIEFPNLINNDGITINKNLFTEWSKTDLSIPALKLNSERKINKVTKDNYKYYANYAKYVQKQSEEVLINLISKAIDRTGIKKVCITGGYGLNVVANSRYIKEFTEVDFYFEPFADDGGNAIGAGMLIYRQETKDMAINKLEHTFHHGIKYELPDKKYNDVDYTYISSMLEKQMSIGIYYGLAEAGPRALGHRSILFDARNADAKNIINTIKKREWYRPFAAACLEEDAYKYFNISRNNGYNFMTINADANEFAIKEIPGVIHIDKTCRIQIVNNPEEPLFKLLSEFKKNTGIGVLLNTSLNLAGEAMVETPEDAISSFERSELDCMWFAEFNKCLLK